MLRLDEGPIFPAATPEVRRDTAQFATFPCPKTPATLWTAIPQVRLESWLSTQRPLDTPRWEYLPRLGRIVAYSHSGRRGGQLGSSRCVASKVWSEKPIRRSASRTLPAATVIFMDLPLTSAINSILSSP